MISYTDTEGQSELAVISDALVSLSWRGKCLTHLHAFNLALAVQQALRQHGHLDGALRAAALAQGRPRVLTSHLECDESPEPTVELAPWGAE